MTATLPDRAPSRTDLAWAIALGGIATVSFAALLYAAWQFAGTLFLIFAGVLFGVFLNALTELTGKLVGGPHGLRLALICLVLTSLTIGVAFLGGNTISQQAKALSGTIKTQIVNVKALLERNGVDTGFLELNPTPSAAHPETTTPVQPRNLPSAGEIASGGGAIVSQTLKLILGTIGAVGNFFIVMFLGLAFAAQPSVYRDGLVRMVPRRYRAQADVIVTDTGEMLKRWLLAQLITMMAVFAVTATGLSLIGIPGAFILGIQAGLLAFIPTVGAILGGLIIVLAAIGSGWIAVVSAFVLFLGVHALESYILTPLIQRQAIDIPPATLFAMQILLGIVFGLWGLALALPLMAIGRVVLDHLRGEEPAELISPAGTAPLAITPET
ncbi:AI-2E family transporter [Rhodopseudomonas palustris]|uniref:AI-2E family transporter n=1 Tax=Rhodopseudomonas palustris TaxID=1076 RepID=UPI000E5A8D72|nr:AI-2E family transporter [Rhodopseudomonas palustris]QLH71810.1 AI-2E family transporter [Rhodopseudomonas palustris]RIA01015.1 AI-2E family transporter [Rhodopseudomonas palustris]